MKIRKIVLLCVVALLFCGLIASRVYLDLSYREAKQEIEQVRAVLERKEAELVMVKADLVECQLGFKASRAERND